MGLSEPTIWTTFGSVGAPTLIPTAFVIGAAVWLRSDILRLRDSMKSAHDKMAELNGRVSALEAGARMRTGLSGTAHTGGAA